MHENKKKAVNMQTFEEWLKVFEEKNPSLNVQLMGQDTLNVLRECYEAEKEAK